MKRTVALVGILLWAGAGVVPAQTEIAQRVRDAVRAAQDRSEVRSETIETQHQESTVTIGSGPDAQVMGTQSGYREEHIVRRRRIADGERRVEEMIRITVEERDLNGTSVRYSIDATVRVISDSIYVRASYRDVTAPGELPLLPPGWVRATSETRASYPGLEELDLDADTESDEMLDMELFDALFDNAVSVTSQPRADGGETVRLEIDGDGARAFFRIAAQQDGDANDPMGEALLAALDADENAITIGIDGEGVLTAMEWRLPLLFESIELAAFAPDAPPDVFMGMAMTFSITGEMLSFDAGDPIVAPNIR
jgi:hypothetical protein